MKLWVITQSGYDRLAIDNYYRKIVIGADFPFSIDAVISAVPLPTGIIVYHLFLQHLHLKNYM